MRVQVLALQVLDQRHLERLRSARPRAPPPAPRAGRPAGPPASGARRRSARSRRRARARTISGWMIPWRADRRRPARSRRVVVEGLARLLPGDGWMSSIAIGAGRPRRASRPRGRDGRCRGRRRRGRARAPPRESAPPGRAPARCACARSCRARRVAPRACWRARNSRASLEVALRALRGDVVEQDRLAERGRLGQAHVARDRWSS